MLRGMVILVLFLGVAAVALQRFGASRREAGWRRAHSETAAQAQHEGLQDLLKARVTGLRVSVAEPHARDVLADAAYVSAALAHHYGLATAREAEQLLARLGDEAGETSGQSEGAGMAAAGAARALLALERGQWAAAEKLARAAAARDHDDVRPLLVQARARTLAGDPIGASKLAEAAALKDPAAAAPLVAWAEARLDLGQAAAALDALQAALKRAPGHTRARLLELEARQTTDGAPTATTDGMRTRRGLPHHCARDATSPVLAAGCALAEATTARLRGDRQTAHARLAPLTAPTPDAPAPAAVATAAPAEPRTLARAAVLLAQLGEIDAAEALATRAAAVADAHMPALAWARVGIALGRGEVPPRLPTPRLAHPDVALLAARAAFASRGPAGLARMLAELGANAASADAELRTFARLGAGGPGDAPGAGPVAAYVAGMRARLAGDLEGAARGLHAALSGHGDACRAAGEYLVVMRLLKRPVGDELAPLRAENAGCVNLALPPPRANKK